MVSTLKRHKHLDFEVKTPPTEVSSPRDSRWRCYFGSTWIWLSLTGMFRRHEHYDLNRSSVLLSVDIMLNLVVKSVCRNAFWVLKPLLVNYLKNKKLLRVCAKDKKWTCKIHVPPPSEPFNMTYFSCLSNWVQNVYKCPFLWRKRPAIFIVYWAVTALEMCLSYHWHFKRSTDPLRCWGCILQAASTHELYNLACITIVWNFVPSVI